MKQEDKFLNERKERIISYSTDTDFKFLSQKWLRESMERQYVYNFDWLGRPIIRYPQDILSIQELIWKVKPDLIIETGIAHGGSLILSASILALLDIEDAINSNKIFDPMNSQRKVIGIDIDIREHNRKAIEIHPMSRWIKTLEGSSIDAEVINKVKSEAQNFNNVMVLLDSMHTHNHVLAELNAYAPLVTVNSYCVVFDTFVEDMPVGFFSDRPWNVGNNPKTAVNEWLEKNSNFEIDTEIETKLQITVAPMGYLKRIK